MWSFHVIVLLGALLSVVSAAAILPARQAPASPICAPTTVYSTIISTVYIPLVATVPPKTVPVVGSLDPNALASQSANDASIDTVYEVEQSQDRPISDAKSTGYPVHTHPLTAPAFPATAGPGTVYYAQPGSLEATVGSVTVTVMLDHPKATPDAAGHEVSGLVSNSINGTASDTVTGAVSATVTYTVSPVPASTSGNSAEAGHAPSYGPPPYGYVNTTSWGYGSVLSSANSAVFTVQTTNYVATAELSVDATETASADHSSASQSQPSGTGNIGMRAPTAVCTQVCVERLGCWCNHYGGPGVHQTDTVYVKTVSATLTHEWQPPTTSSSSPQLAPRQTCTLVSVPFLGTWCNNYEYSTTNGYTVWDTTTTPGVPLTATSAPPVTATASPTACGQSGPFEVSFDQLPSAQIASNDTQDHPPIDQYIDHFVFGDDWTYGPPPVEPFVPHDQPFLGWYIPKLNDNTTNSPVHNTGAIPEGGSFGAGLRKANSTFWFNATSAYAACDNENADLNYTCDFVASAFQYADGDDKFYGEQHFTIPPCQSNVTCQLHMIEFNKIFTKMSAMSFYANVQGQIKPFFMDSLQLDWYDNSCTAGLEREGSP